ncbi:MAG: bifunctional proline dehydrogenase/L-glutamate gamma-semialdehyde dehydrogenase [Kofleriaceae bacterium]|nr:bifunctional proline dehydrogenase/L-glutamate gamma-semialdehyde dehydrogenase [Kofleriaceae bacterium]
MTTSQLSLADTIAKLPIDSDSILALEVQQAFLLARVLQERGAGLQTPQERRQQRELERMMDEPKGRATLMQLTDQAFRSDKAKRVADQLIHILDVQGIPRFFSTLDRAMLKGFQSFGALLPGVSVPRVKSKMREETASVVLPAENELLVEHLEKRKEGGLRMNVNYLGEALLGEDEAKHRLNTYLAALQLKQLDCISVKISTIYSQILPIAREHTINILCNRMELLYRASAKSSFERPNGDVVPKFVYLDMEEYSDLDITSAVFMRTLDRPGLAGVNAGIALQAYLPDSFAVLCEITEWAKKRVAAGGSPVTVRIVKGANMESEKVEASIAGWPQAPYKLKRETDANYKKMLNYALDAENSKAVGVGVASHNLFDVCYGLVLVNARGLHDQVQLEMLEGIANHQRRALHEMVDNVLLYAPATRKEDFVYAIGYLIRRLDENTGPENFLRHAFSLKVDSDEWTMLEKGFIDSFSALDSVSISPRRTQNRSAVPTPSAGIINSDNFANEADTDFSLPQNVAWAAETMASWQEKHSDKAQEIPLVIAGKDFFDSASTKNCYDPSRPELVVGRYCQASSEQIEQALSCAKADASSWRSRSQTDRSKILTKVAQELRIARGDLMGAAMADGAKIFTESDPEVSEAIDFAEYYALSAQRLYASETLEVEPMGVVVVVPPWNFPIAIPCGGIAAALAAGNTVILKPASHTVLVAYELCKCFWRAGVPKEALQFVPCSGAKGGAQLVSSPLVDVVILTGGTDTAMQMLKARPDMNLLAETGGKNATIVTAMSDREQAIKHVVQSAFGHAGQKCSATSLLILEAEVYDDESFKETLCDAVRSLEVGSAWDISTRMGPTIYAPGGDLERAQKELEEGESWAVRPRRAGDNPNLWSPGIKWGVRPGNYTHRTEFFGPVLGVLRADNLEHAIDLVNQTGYGLTSGLESLDSREQIIWKDQIRAGNLYINRGTTGAIVLRQPFGGMGKSVFGPGIKAGGPNYVAQLLRFSDRADSPENHPDLAQVSNTEVFQLCKDLQALPEGQAGINSSDIHRLLRAAASYSSAYDAEFGIEHDHFKLLGQDNIRRYLPAQALRIRVHKDDSGYDIFARVCAARICGCRVTLSSSSEQQSDVLRAIDQLTEAWGASIEFVVESDSELAAIIAESQTDRVRYSSPDKVPLEVREAIGDTGIYIASTPVLQEGRIELLWYMMEQSLCVDYHRYGNLGIRGDETRSGVL